MSEQQKAEMLKAVLNILKKGNDVLIQNRKDSIVIISQKKEIEYRAKTK